MSPPFRRGLVVGKFAPLHRGHELLVRRAMEESEEVVILSWARPELDGCEPEKRARWLASLFPEARRLVVTDALLRERARGELAGAELPGPDHDEATHRRFVGLLCRDLLGVEVDAVFTSESYGPPFAEALTEFFRAGDPGRAPVSHVAVDPARTTVPVSASAVRVDVHAHRRWLPPVVYADFVERVALLGGESSGKSTLAAALGERFGTEHVAEYGRELWEARGGELVYTDLLDIGIEQVRREAEAAGRSRRFLFCDTSPLTTLFYSLEMFGRADPRLVTLAERPYHHVMLCAPDFPFVQDGTRREPGFRERQHAWYRRELARRGVSYVDLAGPMERRLRLAACALGE